MGIGAATAGRLSDEGAAITIADINKEKGKEVAENFTDKGGHAS